MEVDANDHYGWAMSHKMPDGDFEWLSNAESSEMEHRMINDVERNEICNQNKSYIFEVDLDYFPHLSERDDDYPLVPE